MATRTTTRATSRNGTPTEAGSILIPAPNIQTIEIPIVGTSSLIVHAWSEKAKKMMLDKQMKKANKGKEAKDPDADFQASRYICKEADGTEWDGVPAVAFKAALVGACRAVDGLPMTLAKRAMLVEADGVSEHGVELIRIHGDPPRKREDMVRLENGVADVRFRGEYVNWSTTVRIRFNAGVISAEQVANLLQLAGFSEGICEWRPSSPKSATGSHGCWKLREQK